MNTRIMAVALVVVGLIGVRIASGDTVDLVRIVPLSSSPEDEPWAGTSTIIIIGEKYFSLPFLGILTVHEFGHYFTARYHKVKTTLPFL